MCEPGYGDSGVMKTGGDQKWIMGSLLQADRNVAFSNHHLGGGVDEVAKNVL